MQNTKCKMQNDPQKSENIIVEKSFEFAVRVVNLSKYLTREHKEYVLSKQFLRCGTSIGANISEAQRGQSMADFAAKMNIALKEANETYYWLRLLQRTEYLSDSQFKSMQQDLLDIMNILTAICRTAHSAK